MPGDTNGGLVYSHLQNSTIAGDTLTKLGMVVGNKMLEDLGTCFLSGSVHKLRLIGRECHGPRASYFQQPYQVWLMYLQRLWSSGGGNKRVHHLYYQASLAKSMIRKHIHINNLIISIISIIRPRLFLRHFWPKILKKSLFDMIFFNRDFWPRG